MHEKKTWKFADLFIIATRLNFQNDELSLSTQLEWTTIKKDRKPKICPQKRALKLCSSSLWCSSVKWEWISVLFLYFSIPTNIFCVYWNLFPKFPFLVKLELGMRMKKTSNYFSPAIFAIFSIFFIFSVLQYTKRRQKTIKNSRKKMDLMQFSQCFYSTYIHQMSRMSKTDDEERVRKRHLATTWKLEIALKSFSFQFLNENE